MNSVERTSSTAVFHQLFNTTLNFILVYGSVSVIAIANTDNGRVDVLVDAVSGLKLGAVGECGSLPKICCRC